MADRSRMVVSLLYFSAVLSGAVSEFTLTVLHTNDVHARFDEVNPYGGRCPPDASREGQCVGGVSRHMYKVKEVKNSLPNTLFLNAGDYYQGTMWFYLLRSEVVIKVVNFLNHDAMSLGNHEFDDGPEGLLPFVANSTVPILGCNVDFSQEPSLRNYALPASKVLTVGGRKVGLIGYLTPKTSYLSKPGKVKFTDEIECLKKEAARLKKEGVNIIIALGHSGVKKDEEIAKQIPDIGLVVGGHTHTFLYSGDLLTEDKPLGPYPIAVKRQDGSTGLVVQAYWFGKYMGYINVTYDDNGKVIRWAGNPVLLDSSVPKDRGMEVVLAKYRALVEDASSGEIARTKVLLRGDKVACRFRECNLGNLLTDAVMDHYASLDGKHSGWSQVNAAVWNGGGLRASIDEKINKGVITLDDVITVLPFQDEFVLMNLTGKQFKSMMEHAVAEYDVTERISHGQFLQVSGIRVVYDLNKPPGERVVFLETLCTRCRVPRYHPVQDKMYVVAMLNYVANGGDGFNFSEVTEENRINTGDIDTDLVIKYLKKVSPVTAKIEDRIRFVISKKPQTNSGDSVHVVSHVMAVVCLMTIAVLNFIRTL